MSPLVIFVLSLGYFYVAYVCSLQVIPERAEIYLVNDSYVRDHSLNVRKLGRKGGYVINLNFSLLYEFGNNVTMDVLFFEYLHNEYRRSFVEMHFKLCDMIHKDPLIGMAVKLAGLVSCPVKAGFYSLKNVSIPNTENFPYVWPFERARVMGIFTNPKTGVFLANGSVYFTFKQKKIMVKP